MYKAAFLLAFIGCMIRPAAAQFGAELIVSVQALGATSVHVADLDNDGDQDILSASPSDNKIAWYENLDGFGTFGFQRVISTASVRVIDLDVSDIDGDGDLDVLSASQGDNIVAWYENSGNGNFGDRQVITSATFVAQSVYAADIDGDGDADVLSASRDDDTIAWYRNENGRGQFSDRLLISTSAARAFSVYAADIDGDGDLDALSASELDDKIAWYENMDGAGSFSSERVLSSHANAARDVLAADIDGDGDQDVISASAGDDKIAWYRNDDGTGTFSNELVISTNAAFAQDVHVADLDLDGDLDVLSASTNDSKISWYPNVDGLGTFGQQQVIATTASGAASVFAANIDGDLDVDVISASLFDHKIAWYESFAGRGRVRFSLLNAVTDPGEAFGAHAVASADIDNDGDMDVLSASFNDSKVAWYQNNNGELGGQRVISSSAYGARDVFAADLDGDGDMDVLSASGGDNSIKWYENFDGQGSFDVLQIITIDADNAYAVYAADLDGDGDQDVLSASFDDDTIAWYENTDGRGTFSALKTISKATKGAIDVVAGDLDGDGDQDVVAASSFDGTISWFENTGGAFSDRLIISDEAELAISVHLDDLDGDGDLDVLSASSGDNKIAWYENLNGQGSFDIQRIITTQANRAFAVYTADLDSDGDSDVISASRDDNKIAWYENVDSGRFGQQQIVTQLALGARSVHAADLDNDGDPDVLAASQDNNLVAWYENFSIVSSVLDAEDEAALPDEVFISSAYPNPFQSDVTFDVRTDFTQHVKISAWDLQGRQVAALHDGLLIGGQHHKIRFQATDLPSGLYLFRIQGESFVQVKKAILIR